MSFGEDEDTFWGKKIGEAVAHLENVVLLAEGEAIEDCRTLRSVGALTAALVEAIQTGKGHSRFAMVLRGTIVEKRGEADTLLQIGTPIQNTGLVLTAFQGVNEQLNY